MASPKINFQFKVYILSRLGFLKNGPSPASFSFLFSFFKQILQLLPQINVKNVHPVYGAGIRTLTFEISVSSRNH